MRRTALLIPLVAVVASVGCPGTPPSQPTQPPPSPAKPPETTPSRLRPVDLTADDRRDALPRDFPAALRQGMTDEQLGRELALRAWAFEFTGGPIRCWVEFEESGQATVPRREPASGFWECDAADGRVVFSIGQGTSERMRQVMKQQGKDVDPGSVAIQLRFRSRDGGKGGNFGTSHGNSPLWFGWPGGYRQAISTPPVASARDGEPITMLAAEFVEEGSERENPPRKAAVVLKGVFRAVKKE